MEIINWEPRLKASGTSALLQFTGTLSCTACHGRTRVETDGHLLGTIIASTIEWEILDFVSERKCAGCGVPSIVPGYGLEWLKRKVAEHVTPEWMSEQLRKLKTSP